MRDPVVVGDSHYAELLRAFGIGPADLEANRGDRLGPRQIRRLHRNIWWNVVAVGLLQAAVVTLLLLILLVAPQRSFTWIAYPVVGVVLAALTAMAVTWTRQIRRAIREGVVRCAVGQVSVHPTRGGTWLRVEGGSFRLWTGYWHVVGGRTYRVYVAPAAQLIVAMEPENPLPV